MNTTPEIFQDVLAIELNTPISINVDIAPKNDLDLQKHLDNAENVFATSSALSDLLSHTGEHAIYYAEKEIALLDKKLDICLRMLTLLFEERTLPDTQAVKISAYGIEWQSENRLSSGHQLYIQFYPSTEFPRPVMLPVEVISMTETKGMNLIQARFIDLPTGVQNGLEKFIFREHRRQVSRERNN
jgi:hypothetical protein